MDSKEHIKADEAQVLLSMSELVRNPEMREALKVRASAWVREQAKKQCFCCLLVNVHAWQRGRMATYIQQLQRAPAIDGTGDDDE